MVIIDLATGQELAVVVSPVESKDYKHISKKRYFFDWKKERGIADVFKLVISGQTDILGLVAIVDFPGESRLQIHLLCASRENIGKDKQYKGIVGCLVAFAGRTAIKKYLGLACISLLPKTELRAHYKREYGMLDGGPQLYLDGAGLHALVNKYVK